MKSYNKERQWGENDIEFTALYNYIQKIADGEEENTQK